MARCQTGIDATLTSVPASELDIQRTAHLWFHRHGDKAVLKARSMVEDFRKIGDQDSADTRLQIIVAIGVLARSAGARH
jgi:hypothetical protein